MIISVTPTDILTILLEQIKKKYPFIRRIQFDPQLDYESTLVHARKMRGQYSEIKDRAALPALGWNRSVLRTMQNLGRVHKTPSFCFEKQTRVDVKFVMTEMDYQLAVFSSNVPDIERFEVDWYLKRGVREIEKLTISVNNEQVDYSIIWPNDCSDLTFQLEQNYYKAITASGKIVGPIISFDIPEDPAKQKNGLIESIEFTVTSCNNGEMAVEKIIPTEPPKDLLKLPHYEDWTKRQKSP